MAAIFFHPLLAIKLTNAARYLLCMVLFSWKLPRKAHFRRRLAASAALCFLTAIALPILSDSLAYIAAVFLAECLISMLCVRLCWKVDWQITFFVASAAFSCEHIASMADSLIAMAAPDVLSYTITNRINGWILLNYAVCLSVALGIVYYLMFRKLRLDEHHSLSFSAMLLLLVISLGVNLYLNLLYARMATTLSVFQEAFEYSINILLSALLLKAQAGMLRESQAETRLQMTSLLWEQAREQYRISKDTIEMINIKSHDLKHRLLALKDRTSEHEYADIMEAIDAYGSQIETGNEVLDVIFQEKNLACRKHGIQFTCLIDGAVLNFVDSTDLYVLFGNLLDNSIEAVIVMQEDAAKSIQVSVRREKGFAVISVENGFSGSLKWVDGRLRTSKDDQFNHGYGMLSIENVVHKYGGRYSINTDNQIFSIGILLPAKN